MTSSVGKRLSARDSQGRLSREQLRVEPRRVDPLRPPRTRTNIATDGAASRRRGAGKRTPKPRAKPATTPASANTHGRGSHQAFAWNPGAVKRRAQVHGVQGTRAVLSPQPRPRGGHARDDDMHGVGPSRGLDQWSVASAASEREWGGGGPRHPGMGFGSAYSFTAHVASAQASPGATHGNDGGHAGSPGRHHGGHAASSGPPRLLYY